MRTIKVTSEQQALNDLYEVLGENKKVRTKVNANRDMECQLLKTRMPRVVDWVARFNPSVLCLQETKMASDAFPHSAFEEMGYESVHNGQGRWNGVAI